MRSLNIHAIRDSINRLCSFLDEEYDINSGGCCFVASLIAKHLDRLKIPYSLVAYDYLEKDLDYIQYEVLSKAKNKSGRKSVTGRHTCDHYCIKIIGAGEVNNEGFDDEGYSKYIINDVCSSHIKWIYRNGLWNNEYDTNNNKIIKGIIKSFFREYETSSIC